MNILHLVESYLPITESWIYPQIVGDGSWCSHVGSIHRTDTSFYPFPRVKVFSERFPLWRKGSAKGILFRYPQLALFWLGLQFKPGDVDLLHCHFGDLGFYSISLGRHLKVPLIVMFYGYDATRLPAQNPQWRRRYRQLFGKGDLFLVEGNHMKNTLQELGCPERKIRVFHLGVELAQFAFREKSLAPGEPVRLLAAGSFREKKGISCAVEAFARAKKEFPELTLTIIGDAVGNDLEEKRKILHTVQSHGIAEAVRFLGFLPHEKFVEELQRHHLFISPSVCAADGDTEGGSPVAITEASAAGLPVISTFHCDIPEVVLDNQSGRLSAERDVTGLAHSILFFAKNSGAIGEYGVQGRRHVEANYNVKRQLKELRNIYAFVVDEKGN